MSLGLIISLIGFAGLTGGLVNAFFLAHEGLILWKIETLADGSKVWRPGFIGNAFIGAIAALVVAILYSPLAAISLTGGGEGQLYIPTLATLVGAFFAGTGGARILSNEIAKRQLEGAGQDLAKALTELLKK